MDITVDCTSSIIERCLTSCLSHECVIENYSTLKEKICYKMTEDAEIRQRTLKLYKNKKVHSFQFHCELTNQLIQTLSNRIDNKMEFHIMYDQEENVCPNDLVETSYGFSIDVPNELILNPLNKYLHENNKLVIQFRYGHRVFTRNTICQSGTSTTEDEERLSKDFLSLYKDEKLTDFEIVDADDKRHSVHKSICRSRSPTINNIDDKDVCAIQVDGKSRHVEIVIQYMYGGILPELSLDDLLKALEVAESLEVESLSLSLQISILEKLNINTAEKIKRTADDLSMPELAAYTEDILPQEKTRKTRRR